MIIEITRKFRFEAAHRVLGHQGKCRHLHGHSFLAEVTVRGPELDNLGMVVDYCVIKETIGKWIDENWDHNVILHPEDPLLSWFDVPIKITNDIWMGKPPFILDRREGDKSQNPTSENLASYLLYLGNQLLQDPLEITHVRLYETENCFADAFTN